jgi:hypothetical protein
LCYRTIEAKIFLHKLLLFKCSRTFLFSFINGKKNVDVTNMRIVSFTVGYPAIIDNLAKDASNFPSPEEQITFQLEVAEITRNNTILELHAHKQAKGKGWETILENKLPPTLPRSVFVANFRHYHQI